jgi:hypothetical protein
LAAIIDFRYGRPINPSERETRQIPDDRSMPAQTIQLWLGLVGFGNNAFDRAFDRRVVFIE